MRAEIQTAPTTAMEHVFYRMLGLGFLTLAKLKNLSVGYTRARPFTPDDLEQAIAYDHRVVDEWIDALGQYAGVVDLQGKAVLELGPGADMGVGLRLLAEGASRYSAIDVNDLVSSAPPDFYPAFLESLRPRGFPDEVLRVVADELRLSQEGKASRLDFQVRKDFSLTSAFGGPSFDLVCSQAAFEHFDDIDATIRDMSAVARPGALLVAEVDLQTHTRWIRERDPLNIYRYPSRIYRLFNFRGIPNRIRPCRYREGLARHGWTDIQIYPLSQVSFQAADSARPYIAPEFRGEDSEIHLLSIVICARRA